MAPEHEAPGLMGFFDGEASAGGSHCYFKKQPTTPEEIERAISAMQAACCGALRYGGEDQEMVKRLLAAGIEPDCIDHRDQ